MSHRGHTLALEHRLNEPAILSPDRPLAGKQTVAEDEPKPVGLPGS
jgi:hypothetical protein